MGYRNEVQQKRDASYLGIGQAICDYAKAHDHYLDEESDAELVEMVVNEIESRWAKIEVYDALTGE